MRTIVVKFINEDTICLNPARPASRSLFVKLIRPNETPNMLYGDREVGILPSPRSGFRVRRNNKMFDGSGTGNTLSFTLRSTSTVHYTPL